MNSFDNNQSKVVSLSRSVVLTEESRIPSLLLLGKLVSNNGAAADMGSLGTELVKAWDPSGDVNLWRVTAGAFLIQLYGKEDLTRVLDGAPWSCRGGNLFLVQHVKPEMNLMDQVQVGFNKTELWVQFHHVPVEYVSTGSVYKLAARIGEPVQIADFGAAAVEVEFLRARIEVDITKPLVRSLPVNFHDEGSRREVVSVVYEKIPTLCDSCGIIGHPVDRCPKVVQQGTAASRSLRREKSVGISWARLGSRNSSSSGEAQPGGFGFSRLGLRSLSAREERQQLLDVEEEDHSNRSFVSPTKLLRSETDESSAGTNNNLALERPHPRLVSSTRCLPCINFLKLSSFQKKTAHVRDKKAFTGEIIDSQASQKNQKHQALTQTISTQLSVQEPIVKEAEETHRPGRRLALGRPSSFQLAGGCLNYYSYLGSRKNRRIEVIVETQCSTQLMEKAMDWLHENTGLKASYDGKRGIIIIVGLQVDQIMDPLDLVAYLYPEARPKTGATDAQLKPDSPARFENMVVRFHDENCCRAKSATSGSRNCRLGCLIYSHSVKEVDERSRSPIFMFLLRSFGKLFFQLHSEVVVSNF